jgi:hypothetical protein
MVMQSRLGILVVAAWLTAVSCTQAQEAPSGTQAAAARVGGRPPVGPTETEHYHSTLVKLGGNAADGLLYEPKTTGKNSRVAILYSNSNFGFAPPATELASRGYRVLFVPHPPRQPGEIATPFDGFNEASRGIAYLRTLPGVESVVAAGWGNGAGSVTLYADVAAHGPAACQGKEVIYPCTKAQASGLARLDGLILFDPALGSGYRVGNQDPAYEGGSRRSDLDIFSAANGYDAATGTATYSADFRKRYFAAQSTRNDHVVDDAVARLKVLDQGKGQTADEPLIVPGAVNVGDVASLHHVDLSILSHTKRPHTLLKADGSKPEVVLHSIRPSNGPVGADAIKTAESKIDQPARNSAYSLREYLANDAVRTTRDYALTADDVIGVVWKSSNTATPAQAEGVTVPTLVMTNTCFQFVVTSEIVYDHIAAKDKTYAGVEGSEHFFTACAPQYGDPVKRMFDFVDDWLGKPGRF